MKHIKSIFLVTLLAVVLQACKTDDTIRVLCIGNSFSWDAVEQELAPLCEAGNQPIIIGDLYYGGCSLEQHHTFLLQDTGVYHFRYIENGVLTDNKQYSLRQALQLMQWDYISFQQASHDSGIQSTYEPYLIRFVHINLKLNYVGCKLGHIRKMQNILNFLVIRKTNR